MAVNIGGGGHFVQYSGLRRGSMRLFILAPLLALFFHFTTFEKAWTMVFAGFAASWHGIA